MGMTARLEPSGAARASLGFSRDEFSGDRRCSAIAANALFYARLPSVTRGVEVPGCGAGLRACGIGFRRRRGWRREVRLPSPRAPRVRGSAALEPFVGDVASAVSCIGADVLPSWRPARPLKSAAADLSGRAGLHEGRTSAPMQETADATSPTNGSSAAEPRTRGARGEGSRTSRRQPRRRRNPIPQARRPAPHPGTSTPRVTDGNRA